MSTLLSFVVLASLANGSAVETAKVIHGPKTEPVFQTVPKPPAIMTRCPRHAAASVVAAP